MMLAPLPPVSSDREGSKGDLYTAEDADLYGFNRGGGGGAEAGSARGDSGGGRERGENRQERR